MRHEREQAKDFLRTMVGNYEDMKPLTEEQEAMMVEIAKADALDSSGKTLASVSEKILKKEKDAKAVTMLYLYCNWRVWMTYEQDEALARRYQDACDEIDNYIFDNYDKESIAYFVKETD